MTLLSTQPHPPVFYYLCPSCTRFWSSHDRQERFCTACGAACTLFGLKVPNSPLDEEEGQREDDR